MASKNFDAELCGSLPLHNINLIQPYGYLLVLNQQTLDIIQVSENIEELLSIKAPQLIDTPFSKYVYPAQLERMQAKFETGMANKIPLSLTLSCNNTNHNVLALVHAKNNYLILELEKVAENTERYFTDVFQEIKYAMTAIEMAGTVANVCTIAIQELKKLSGFDGIMMYRFDNDWNGTVIAEEKNDGLESYLGNTFPASDVPKQARALYLENPYRLIPNREYTPVRLYPVINPLTNAFIDLSACNLRGVASVHLEYLKNMGVMASMSIRVINDGKLWGLIACHHLTAKYVNYEMCSIFELLSGVVSNRISYLDNKQQFDEATHLHQQRAALIEQVYVQNDLAKGILNNAGVNMMDVFKATGAVVIEDGKFNHSGQVPEREYLENVIRWLQGKQITKTFESNNLAEQYDEAAEYTAIASGILAIPVDSERGNYILCFRPEVVRTINWGGNPNQAINITNDGKSYHPRDSFKLWQQTVRQTSQPWTVQEIAAAEMFRSFAFEFKTKQILS